MAVRKPPAERPGTPLSNRNFLSPTGFKFSLKRSPAAAFFCNQANIPSMDLGVATQPTYLRDIPTPGDKIDFGDLNIRFLVDEDLVNYMELQRWIRGLGFPDSMKDFKDLEKEAIIKPKFANKGDNIYSDGTLQILTSTENPNFKVVFQNLFPYQLSTLTFDATDEDINYFTADVSFKYTMFNITDLSGNKL